MIIINVIRSEAEGEMIIINVIQSGAAGEAKDLYRLKKAEILRSLTLPLSDRLFGCLKPPWDCFVGHSSSSQ